MASEASLAATIAIPVFNSAATLARCLRSAMNQTRRDIEILVLDDCSTDSSAEIARSFAQEDGRIHLMSAATNQGKPHAMNQMVQRARGRWLAVLDADDAFHPERLERLIEAAEAAQVEMAADNLVYIDSGADIVVRTAFETGKSPRLLSRKDLAFHSNSYAEFDFGILKPVMRVEFLRRHDIAYYERTRLAEDFYYLMNFFVAGGRAVLLSEPLYYWTMPFGTISRQWTSTGSGSWRYDYRPALQANEHFIRIMAERGEHDIVAMLRGRSRQYHAMIHYLNAQRRASEGAWFRSLAIIAAHPSTYALLLRRVAGRIRRRLSRSASGAPASVLAHPSLRASEAAPAGAGQ